MAQTTITHFTRAIQSNLYQGAEFLNYAVDHDIYSDGSKVQVPIPGSMPSIEKDRSSYPIPVVERTDDTREYALNKFDLGAVLVPESDKRTLSYNKAADILSEHMNALTERIGLEALYNWSPTTAARKIVTTGSTISTNPSGTANSRKAIKIKDISAAAAKLTNDKAYRKGKMYSVMPGDMYYSMLADNTELLNENYMDTANLPDGVVSRIMGFNIILTPMTTRYDNSDSRKAVGSAVASTDDWSALFYCSDFVSKARGSIKVFLNSDDATYQGDIYSAYVRFRANLMRDNEVGIVVLQQTS